METIGNPNIIANNNINNAWA